MHIVSLLLPLAVVLGTALLMGRLARRVGLPAVLGELCAGVVLGTSLLVYVAPPWLDDLARTATTPSPLVVAAGKVGVLLLVGITGMHVDLPFARRNGAAAARVSLGGLAIPLTLGAGCGLLLPSSLIGSGTERGVFAVFIGVALCVSAIPVISKMLIDMRLLHRDFAQLTLSAAMIDDAAGWLMLSIVLGAATAGLTFLGVAGAFLKVAAIVVFALVLGRPLVRAAVAPVADGRPLALAAVLAGLVLAGAYATGAIGAEPVAGAFVCGVLIGSCTGVDAGRAVPLNVLVVAVLAPIFFVTAGLKVDLSALGEPGVAVAGVAVVAIAIVGKFTGAFVGARMSDLGRWEAVALGAGLNARGVIGIVIATTGLQKGVLNATSYTILLLVAIVTSFMAAPVLRIAERRIPRTDADREREAALGLYPVTAPQPAHHGELRPRTAS
jgi:Kef-type K+ transport system membrane component KefB